MSSLLAGDLKDLLGRVADLEGMYRHEHGRRKRLTGLLRASFERARAPALLTIRKMRVGWKINGHHHPAPQLGVTVACEALLAFKRGKPLDMRRYGHPKSIHKAVRHDAVKWARRAQHLALETALLNLHKKGDFLYFRPPRLEALIVSAK